jgi:hypothetical protein
VIIDKKNVFGLEIRVNEIEIVKNCAASVKVFEEKYGGLTSNTCQQLPCKALYLAAGKGYERVTLQEIKDTLS